MTSHAATITGWDFEDGTLQGWTNVSTSTTGPMNFAPLSGTPGSGVAGWDPLGFNSKVPEYGFMAASNPFNVPTNVRDAAQSDPLVLRSPTFALHDGQIIAHLLGGTPGAVATASNPPSNFSDLSGPSFNTNGSSPGGDASYIGIALRRDSDGAYLLHKSRTGNSSSGTGWEQLTFTQAELLSIMTDNPGALFTLDLI